MDSKLATRAFLLIPLLTLSTGLLGPDILLTVQKLATSDHVLTDFNPQAVPAQLDWIFTQSTFKQVIACLIHFSGSLPGSARGSLICHVTDQMGNVIGSGLAFVIAADVTTEGCTGLATVADPTTGLGVGDIVVSTTCKVFLDGPGPVDVQEVDDAKVIVIGPSVRP